MNSPSREDLEAFAAALGRCYVLSVYPREVLPHLFALLRSRALRDPALAARLEERARARSRPWLRLTGGSGLDTGPIRVFPGHPHSVESCDVSPDGCWLASAGPADPHRARTLGALWDAGSGEVLETFRGPFRPLCRFSPDGRRVAFGAWLCDVETRRMHSALSGHRICDLAWCPRGEWIATVGDPDGAVVLWRAEVESAGEAAARRAMPSLADLPRDLQDEELVVLRRHGVVAVLRLPEPFDAWGPRQARVAFSPDGGHLAAANGRSLAVWETAGLEERLTARAIESNPSCCFSRDGKRFFWAGSWDPASQLWRPRWWDTTGWTELPFPDDPARGNLFDWTFSSNGRGLFAEGGAGLVAYVDLEAGGRTSWKRLHRHHINECRSGPDGRVMVTASEDRSVRLWRTDTVRRDTVERPPLPVHSCSFSPDGRTLVSNSSGRLTVWDARGRREIGPLPGHEEDVQAFGFSPDGRRLVSMKHDGTIRICELERGVEQARWHHPGELASGGAWRCAFSGDGSSILTAAFGSVRLWDARTLRETLALPAENAALSADGGRIASTTGERDGTITLWGARNGAKLAVLQGHPVEVWECGFSPDGTLLASCSAAGIVKVWRLSDGVELLAFSGHDQSVYGFAFHPSGRWILSAGADDKLLLWEPGSGSVAAFLYGLSGGWQSCAFSPGGTTLAAGDAFGRLMFFELEPADFVARQGRSPFQR